MRPNPEALYRQAWALQQAGRAADAVVVYQRLLALHADLPDCWYNLGLLQRQLGRFDLALAAYQQALARGVGTPEEVHLNRGVIYADGLQQPDAAERELQAALRLNPRYVPALLNLGNLEEDRGRRDAAAACYERALAIDPANVDALARLAGLSRVSDPQDALVLRLRSALARRGLAAADAASLGFALGRLLDACGAYDEAFRAYAEANRHSRAGAPAALRYDREAHERLVSEIIEFFTPQRCRELASNNEAVPLFICGMFRSGSTLAEQVLAAHPRVTAGGEVDFIPACVRAELAPYPASLERLGAAGAARLATRYQQRLAQLFPAADRITDKRPDNFLHIGLIKAMFPRARIVHTRRAPLDNCLSVFFLHLDAGMAYATDLMDIGHYYAQYRRLMAHWKTLFGDDILDLDYDELVREPRPVIERLLAHCGLDWHEGCLDFHEVRNAVRTASVWQVREPLYQRSSGRARHYERQLAPLAAWLERNA